MLCCEAKGQRSFWVKWKFHSPVSALSVPWVVHLSGAGDNLSALLCHSRSWCCPSSDPDPGCPSQRTISSLQNPDLSLAHQHLHRGSSARPCWLFWGCWACWLGLSHLAVAPVRTGCDAALQNLLLCRWCGVLVLTRWGGLTRCEVGAEIGCAFQGCLEIRWSISSVGSLLQLYSERRADAPCVGWTAHWLHHFWP